MAFMAGIYLHIPFCKQACHYCNFHFSTSLAHKDAMVQAIVKELSLQIDYLPEKKLGSIYFGGGTPSLLNRSDFEQIFKALDHQFEITADAEITLEANPDDLDAEKVQLLRDLPINRLSIGIQSFFDEDLQWMNRAHKASEARQAIELSQAAGFDNITIDLIYGSPTTSDAVWEKNLELFRAYQLKHLSSYALTVESGTALGKWVETKKIAPMDESRAARQFEILQERTKSWGMEQYEISNFAHPGNYARHNLNYWRGVAYLGIGPSAHSFNGQSRQWNIANNAKYIKAIAANEVPTEKETLSSTDQFNEYIMVSLRTQWGISREKIKTFEAKYLAHFDEQIKGLINEKIKRQDQQYILLPEHRFFADGIASDLFYED